MNSCCLYELLLLIIHYSLKSSFRHPFQRLLSPPAAGHRNRETGDLNVVGTYGYVWSSSPYASDSCYAGFLRFLAGELTPLRADGRALGFPVRCVQHLRLLFSLAQAGAEKAK